MRSRISAGAEQHVVVLAEAPRAVVLDLLAGPLELDRARGEIEHAAVVEARVDLLLGDDAGDLVDGVEHRPLLVDDRRAPVRAPATALERAREGGAAPAAVAARGAEAGDLPLEHDDPGAGSAFFR